MPATIFALVKRVIVFSAFLGGAVCQSSPNNRNIESLIAEGRKLRAVDCARAIDLFSQARALAVQLKLPLAEATAGLYAGACEIRLFRYRSAIASLSDAEAAAHRGDDRTLLGAIAGNMSVIYSQLGDYIAANAANVTSVAYLRGSQRHDYLVSALINLGESEFGLERTGAGKQAFSEAIEIATRFGLQKQEASARDDLGIWLVLKGQLREAQQLLLSAYRIRQSINDVEDFSVSLEHLAELREKLGGASLFEALYDINQALKSPNKWVQKNPIFYYLHTRGRIYRRLEKTQEALQDFRQAVVEAEAWRRASLPGDAIRTRPPVRLAEVYQDCTHLLAAIALKTGDQSLMKESFEVLLREQNNSLEDKLTRVLQIKLFDNPEYQSLLQQLQSAQAQVTLAEQAVIPDDAKRRNLLRVKAKLHDFEYRFGIDMKPPTAITKSFGKVASLQSELAPDTALLTFSLGTPYSYLWAVTTSGIDLYALPEKEKIAREIAAFRATINQNHAANSPAGSVLSQSLFGKLSRAVLEKKEWLIAADGELLDLMPFAALPSLDHSGFLVDQRATRIVTGFRFSDRKQTQMSSERFLGIGDPIYNHADPRYRKVHNKNKTATQATGALLGRLVSSGKEVETSARVLSLRDTKLLLGGEARIQNFVESTRLQGSPIIHFAVHVISPQGHPGEAALALSVGTESLPELLTPENISTLRIPGALVVLSGCASQQGDVVPGTGIVGLSRSWLLAGAAAVVVSAWPTPEDSGDFFRLFYERLRITSGPMAHRASIALRSTQLVAKSSSHQKSNMSVWAAYSVVARN